MQATKNFGRILGLLFLASVVAGGTSLAFRGLGGGEPGTAGFLEHLVEVASEMKLAIALDMLTSAIAIGMALFLYPIMRHNYPRLALAYTSIAIINFVVITVSNVIHVQLLSLGAEFVASPAESQHLIGFGQMYFDAYYWIHFLMLMLYSIGGSALYYYFFKTGLVPKWLALWGLLAAAIVFMGGALQIADISVTPYLFVQNGVFTLILIGWLLVVGFKVNQVSSSA